MAKIERVTTGYYRIALAEVLSDAMHGTQDMFQIVTMRVLDSDGSEGVGYTFTNGHNGSAIAAVARDEIEALAIGEDADLIEALWEKIWWKTHYAGRGGPTVLALSAFDIALWDLKAKRANLPLWKLLGGYRDRVSCYAGGIDLHLDPEPLVEQTKGNLERGFRAIKMKVGRDNLSEDVARVAAMRDFLGDGFPLMVDANMKYTADEAIRAARAFQPFDLTWFEEPVIPDDIAGNVRVAREGGIPLATGENMRTLWEFKAMIEAGGTSWPEPDVTNCGGVTPFMKIAHLAEAYNLPVTSHGAHDITVHLLCACPNGQFLEAHGFGLEDYISEPMRIKDGLAVAPDRAGHGMEFNWEKLETIAC